MEAYPSRQYAYGSGAALAEPALPAGRVLRFVLGIDPTPRALRPDEPQPTDAFWRSVLAPGHRPLTLDAVLAATRAALPQWRSFVVSDGGQIPWRGQDDDLRRSFRVIVALGDGVAAMPAVLVSAPPAATDPHAFLQVIAWDPQARAYQFYERRQDAWIWAGSSWEAFDPRSRGKGPFDSHVNGALNMKELKLPWLHWHSQSAPIRDTALDPADPFLAHPVWTQRSDGNQLETDIIRPGIERWTAARFDARTREDRLTALPEFLRQVLTTSTINLTSTAQEFRVVAVPGRRLRLPLTFFLDSDSLINVLAFEPEITVPEIAGQHYAAALAQLDVHLTDGQTRLQGDTHFAFAVPEPAFEDVDVLRGLLERGILSRRVAAAMLMVDFSNPVFSERRTALLPYVPAASLAGDPGSFEQQFSAALSASAHAADPASAESECLAHLRLSEASWEAVHLARIEAYFGALDPVLRSADGVHALVRLADSRRREFRKRPLAEFPLNLPFSHVPDDAPLLQMSAQGHVIGK